MFMALCLCTSVTIVQGFSAVLDQPGATERTLPSRPVNFYTIDRRAANPHFPSIYTPIRVPSVKWRLPEWRAWKDLEGRYQGSLQRVRVVEWYYITPSTLILLTSIDALMVGQCQGEPVGRAGTLRLQASANWAGVPHRLSSHRLRSTSYIQLPSVVSPLYFWNQNTKGDWTLYRYVPLRSCLRSFELGYWALASLMGSGVNRTLPEGPDVPEGDECGPLPQGVLA
ncbi:hypothetical protein DFP72DRAFT_1052002 [Ephemerocybe angulata]|uniref:Uncharacterized protein n=1 Tax=Ephemerocybe angulata TaxID=980116 RepID=A0A8H6HEP5_9AGAR|nr:hypothetical protein DFP72DRAFT_1052002 [Tulosesus angulatus]